MSAPDWAGNVDLPERGAFVLQALIGPIGPAVVNVQKAGAFNRAAWAWDIAEAPFNDPITFGIVSPVPEPSTVVAGSLLLIPFALSTIRFARRNRQP